MQPVLLLLIVLLWLLYVSADMTFYKFLELHPPSSIHQKKFFVTNSTFLMDSRNPLLLLNHQNPPSGTSFF